MGGVAGALLNLQGRMGLAGWQWLFLVEGLPALVLSAVFLAYLPDAPADAKWLTAGEREWLVNKLRAEDAAIGDGHAKDVFHAILNPRILQLGTMLFCIYIGVYGFSLSAPVIVRQVTHLSDTNVGFIIAGFGLLGALGLLLNGMHSDSTGERYLHVAVPTLLMAAACVVGGISVSPLAALPAYAIIVMVGRVTAGPAWVIPSSFLTGKSAAAGIATINAIAILGGFVGPYWMGLAKDWTGNYQTGLLTLALPTLAGAGIVLYMRHQTIHSRTQQG